MATTLIKTQQKVSITSAVTFGILVAASIVVMGSFAAGITMSASGLFNKKIGDERIKNFEQPPAEVQLVLGKNVLLKKGEKNTKKVAKNLLFSEEAKKIFKIKIPEVNQTEITIKNQLDCLQFSISGEGLTSNVGHPELPAVTSYLEVPFEASIRDISVDIDSAKFETFELEKEICPAQEPLPDLAEFDDSTMPLTQNKEIYQKFQFYPEKLILLQKPRTIRQHKILPVVFFPLSYNPATKELKVYYEAEIKVSLNNVRSKQDYKIDPRYQAGPVLQLLNNLVLGGSELPTLEEKSRAESKSKTRESADYLIISHESFVGDDSPLNNLVAHKMNKGLAVKLASLADIESVQGGRSADDIAAYH